MAKVKELMELLRNGFRPYEGAVDGQVYESLRCPNPNKAAWFVRDRDATYFCLGCARHCLKVAPVGFQVSMLVPRHVTRYFTELPQVSAAELLRAKRFLRVDEAAFCLGVSERQVRHMIDNGVLVRHQDPPVRVTVESVQEEMERLNIA
jgi:hypothetical protein